MPSNPDGSQFGRLLSTSPLQYGVSAAPQVPRVMLASGEVPQSCDDHSSGSDILLLLIIEVSQRLLVASTDVDAELFLSFRPHSAYHPINRSY